MKTNLISLLETFGYPVFLHGSMNDDDEYPQSFFTFWNFDTPEASFYDNESFRAEWGFTVCFYSDDPLRIDETIDKTIKLLKENNWIIEGKGKDAVSDEKTHTGREITCWKIESYKE